MSSVDPGKRKVSPATAASTIKAMKLCKRCKRISGTELQLRRFLRDIDHPELEPTSVDLDDWQHLLGYSYYGDDSRKYQRGEDEMAEAPSACRSGVYGLLCTAILRKGEEPTDYDIDGRRGPIVHDVYPELGRDSVSVCLDEPGLAQTLYFPVRIKSLEFEAYRFERSIGGRLLGDMPRRFRMLVLVRGKPCGEEDHSCFFLDKLYLGVGRTCYYANQEAALPENPDELEDDTDSDSDSFSEE